MSVVSGGDDGGLHHNDTSEIEDAAAVGGGSGGGGGGGGGGGEGALEWDLVPLSLPYTISEVLVAVVAVLGNALTITVFVLDRKLRRLTNYYIVSLALADLLVGVLGIPFAILTAVGLPRQQWACLPMLSTLLILCTISIFCLVAVSVDRYWAILHPLRYSRVMTAKIARRIILVCWAAGTLVGCLPVMGWAETQHGACLFTKVMNYDYLVFLYFCTIVGPGILMAVFYTHIYTVVLKQTKLSVKSEHGTLRQIAAQEPQADTVSMNSNRQQRSYHHARGSSRNDSHRSTSTNPNLANQVTHASRREVKAAKSLSIIVLFFMISWFPLYTINCVQAFCKQCPVPEGLMFFTIILTHLNSAINPFLYAYHMNDFRQALKRFLLQYVLRKPVDDVFNRSMASTHHYSTHYRVNIGESPHIHTPHSHTPLTSSPIPGTPLDELRSRTSTLGSCGHWHYNLRGISTSPSHPSSPALITQSIGRPVLCEPFRPRAATFTSLTAQAQTKIPTAPRDASSQPFLFPPTILKQNVAQEQHSLTKEQATTSNSQDSLPTHHHPATQPYNTAKLDPLTYSSNQETGSKELTDRHIKMTPKTVTKSRHVTESLCDGMGCCDTEKINVTEAANVTRAQQDMSEDRQATDPVSPTFFLHCSSHSLNTEEITIGPSVFVTDKDIQSKTSQYEKSDREDNCSEACESRCHEIKCGNQEKHMVDTAGKEHGSNTVLFHSHVMLNVQGNTKETNQGIKTQSTPSIISKCTDLSYEEDTLLIPQYITEKNEGETVGKQCTLQKHSREDTAGNGSHFSLVQNMQAVRSRTPCSTKLMPNGSSCGITCQHEISAEDTTNEQLAHAPAHTEMLYNQFYTSACNWKISSNQPQNKSNSDSTTPLLENIDPHLQQGLHKPIVVEDTAITKPEDENSPTHSVLPQQLSKYLPKILQRQKGSRSGRRGNKWWSDVMRNKSYHGLSMEIKSSDPVKRAQSISGAIET